MRMTYQQPVTVILPLEASPVLVSASEQEPAAIINDKTTDKLNVNDLLHYGGDATDDVTPTAKPNTIWEE